VLKKSLSLTETLALSAFFSLTVPPLLLTLENESLYVLFPQLPLVNALGIFAITLIAAFTVSRHTLQQPSPFALTWQALARYVTSPFFGLSFVLYGTIAVNVTGAFYALPDLDPYYWLSSFRDMIAQGKLTGLSGYRPLFSSLTYIFTQGAHIDLYAFFKYVLPASFLALLPAFVLVAQPLKHSWQKTIIAFFPFVNGVTFLYMTEPIPQAILSLLVFFSIAFLAYSFLTGNTLFLLLSGLPLLFGYFYHEANAILLLIWALFMLFFFRKTTLQLVMQNKLSACLFLLLILPYLSSPAHFLYERIEMLTILLYSAKINLLFPQHYVNIDGNQMGWGNFWGVIKYYLFYMGPAVFLAIAAPVALWKKYPGQKKFLKRPEIVLALLSFGVFFVIAEILPRVANIALLPERAWIFAGPYALFLLFPLFQTRFGQNKVFLGLLIASFIINLGGALYINTLKKYIVTDAQLASAEWIRNTLPDNRVLFSFGNHRLLTFYGSSQLASIKNPDFYFDHEASTAEIASYKTKKTPPSLEQYRKQIKKSASKLLDFSATTSEEDAAQTVSMLAQEIKDLDTVRLGLEASLQPINTNHSLYIYYAAPHPKNPYANRPYVQQLPSKEDKIIFDQYPEEFKKIYADEVEKIYIWQIL
jgi:hypothetical protein